MLCAFATAAFYMFLLFAAAGPRRAPSAVGLGHLFGFDDMIVAEDVRAVFHAVFCRDAADDAAGHAGGKTVVRDVAGDDTARADDAIVAHRHTRADRHTRAEPAVVTDAYGLGITDMARGARLVCKEASFVRQ